MRRTISASRLMDRELLLALAAIAERLGFDRPEAEGRIGAVEEAPAGVLLHRPGGVLRVLLALVLVEHGEDAPGEFPRRVVARLLGDRDDLDAVLGELPLVESEGDGVPKEAREAVDDDGLEGRRVHRRIRDQLLKHRTLVIGGRGTRLDVLLRDQVSVPVAPFAHLAQLVRNGKVLLRLSRRGDPSVERHGHVALLLAHEMNR